ncbi:MAG: hypothetical protein M3Y33_14215 [Actinomycetota bacterium]|nr:hypothetical protein [Actinomycetota bacterium]
MTAVAEMRAERRGYAPGSADLQAYCAEAQRLRSEALSASPAPAAREGRVRRRIRSRVAWATGIVAAALLTLIGTAVAPAIARQFASAPRIEDSLRRGPAIIARGGEFDPADGGISLPFVLSGNRHISRALARGLSRPGSGANGVVQQQLGALHGITTYQMFILLKVRGNRNQEVQINSITLALLHRTAPVNGTFFNIGPQGETENIRMEFNLDQAQPLAYTMSDGMVPTRIPYFIARSISLSLGESRAIAIQVDDLCNSADFLLAVRYSVGSAAAQTMLIGDGSTRTPFRVTGLRWVGDEIVYRKQFDFVGNFSIGPPGAARLAAENHYSPGDDLACPSDHY